MHRRRLLIAAIAAMSAASAGPALLRRPAAAASAEPLTVFAAASLQDALRALDREWRARGGAPLRLSFAASSTLARQIEQGAPADIFASADEAWMDHLQQRGMITPGTRVSALSNRLALIAPADSPAPDLALRPGAELLPLLGPTGRIAVGDPSHVPAGRYARQALESLGLWKGLEPRLAQAENVRAALLLVERGEAPLGIVYATDALASRGVRVLGTFPADSHTPISYPFALTRRAASNDQARALLAFLTGPEAAPVWRRFGFAFAGERA